MPTVLRVAGYRFFFWSRENLEPPHIHVEQAERYREFFEEKWREHFRSQGPPGPA